MEKGNIISQNNLIDRRTYLYNNEPYVEPMHISRILRIMIYVISFSD